MTDDRAPDTYIMDTPHPVEMFLRLKAFANASRHVGVVDHPGLIAQLADNQFDVIDIPAQEEPLVVGRNVQDCLMERARISRQHFKIHYNGGDCELEDCGSSNGTFVNGSRVDGHLPIKDGDVIDAGGVLFLVNLPG